MPDFKWVNDATFVRQLITDLGARLGVKPATVSLAHSLQSRADDPAAIDDFIARDDALPIFAAIQDLVAAADRFGVRSEIVGLDRQRLNRALAARGEGLDIPLDSRPDPAPASLGAQRLSDALAYAEIEPARATKSEVRAISDIVKSLPKPTIKRIFGTSNTLFIGTLVRLALKAISWSSKSDAQVG